MSECLEITSACEREAVEEAAKDCVTRVSEFLAGEKWFGLVGFGVFVVNAT